MNAAARKPRTDVALRAKGSAWRFVVPTWLLMAGSMLASASFADVSLVSVTSEGTKGNAQSTRPDVSGDGHYVVFGTSASTLRPEPSVEGYTTPGGYSCRAVRPMDCRTHPVVAATFWIRANTANTM